MTLRILAINHEFPPLGGGASPVTQSVCEALARLGHRVDVVTMGFRGLPRFETRGGVRIHRVPSFRRARHIAHFHELLSFLPGALAKGLALLRTERFDVIHCHFILPGGVVAWLLHRITGVPYVVTAHGTDVPGYNPDRFRGDHRILRFAWRRIVRDAGAVTSPSRWLADLIKAQRVALPPLHVIPNGIASDWISPAPKHRRLLFVSRLFERKGVQDLLEALRSGPLGVPVDIVGDGPIRARLETLARDVSDPVCFHGWLEPGSPELRRLYAESAIFAFPSHAENFPMCLLEAMLAGMAVVASDIPPCREVLEDTALFAEVGNAAALRTHLEALVNHPAQCAALGTAARQRVFDHFELGLVGESYEKLLAAVAGTLRVART